MQGKHNYKTEYTGECYITINMYTYGKVQWRITQYKANILANVTLPGTCTYKAELNTAVLQWIYYI